MRDAPGQTPWHDRAARSLARFLATETGSAGLLLAATVAALVWANSPLKHEYADLWSTHANLDVAGLALHEDLRHWVNDGLMALFFFVIGLEIRRELEIGDLRDRRAAAVPAIAALAGMVAPALIYTAVNLGGRGAHGWGIVMATDVAFVLGALALLGSRAPAGVRLFLLTLAIVDDVGAIVVIAVFYAHGIDGTALAVAGGLLVAIVVGRRLWRWSGPVYAVAGLALWVATLKSGVHPTIAGVVLGALVAASPRDGAPDAGADPDADSPNERFEALLHPLASYLVIPLFALANAGVELGGGRLGHALGSPVTLGVIAGLVLGKALGIGLATSAAVRLGVGPLPEGFRPRHLPGASSLAGIGFTVSLFIADLAFDDPRLRDEAKVGVLIASVLAALLGVALLRRVAPGDGGDSSG